MKSIAAAATLPGRLVIVLRSIGNDALYRGSLFLLINTIATSALGFVFWTLAAHRYSATTIGVFSSLTSGVTLLAAIAALGLPITMTRHMASTENPRGLVLVAVTMITTGGTALCLATMLFLGPHLPSALHVQQRGRMALLVTILVVFTAMGGTLDAGLVANRSTRFLLIKNLIASMVKVIAMLFLVNLRSSGLLISLGLALVLAAALSLVTLTRRPKGTLTETNSCHVPWHYLSITSGNYLATVIGILPLSIVPIEVLAIRGATQTARFAIAFLIAGFLNFIPSTMGQVLFAETARGEMPLGRQLRKALRAVYCLLLPCLALLLIAAPFVLRLFGRSYATDATGCLRVLALGAIPAGGTYLVDSLLTARDRTGAYTFMQVANAALVLGCVGLLLPRGLTAGASGLVFAQVITLLLGLLVLATGKLGRHHPRARTKRISNVPLDPLPAPHSLPLNSAAEPEIPDPVATRPMISTALTADFPDWNQSAQILASQLVELRSTHVRPHQDVNHIRFPAGETAQCGLWFPHISIPVGFGQTRSTKQLPVLTMITGYSGWLSAILVPSTRPEDIFAGWWKLIAELGAVPRSLAMHSEQSIGRWIHGQAQITAECNRFCRSLGTTAVLGRTGEPATVALIEDAQIGLDEYFLRGRIFQSPSDFNSQLHNWLVIHNMRPRRSAGNSPAALSVADKRAMLPLPPIPPATGWRTSAQVGTRPFISFDYNEYSVDPTAIGRMVEIIADLSYVRVACDGKVVANHARAWARGTRIHDPAHGTALR